MLSNLNELKEIIKLRLVSRKFKRLVDTFQLQRVCFAGQSFMGSYRDFNPKPISNQVLFSVKSSYQLIRALSSCLFKGITYLNIAHKMSWIEFDIEMLNHLTALQRLDIDWIATALYQKKRLNLPNLTCLLVNKVNVEPYVDFIELNAPKLEILRQPHLDCPVNLLHPWSVRRLWIDKLNDVKPRLDLLAKFVNLQVFQLSHVHFTVDLNVWFGLYASLEQLRFLGTFQYKNSSLQVVADYQGAVLDFLMAQKVRLGREKTKVFFDAVQLIDGVPYAKQGFDKDCYNYHFNQTRSLPLI